METTITLNFETYFRGAIIIEIVTGLVFAAGGLLFYFKRAGMVIETRQPSRLQRRKFYNNLIFSFSYMMILTAILIGTIARLGEPLELRIYLLAFGLLVNDYGLIQIFGYQYHFWNHRKRTVDAIDETDG